MYYDFSDNLNAEHGCDIYLPETNEKRILGTPKQRAIVTVLMECIVTKIWDFEKGKALV